MSHRIFSITLLCILLLFFGYMSPPWGYNQATRLDVLHAIFTEGTIAIDTFHENTGDKIEWNGHMYSEKAPGIVVLAMPAFAVIHVVLKMLSIDINGELGWKISEWFTTLFSVGLLCALSALALFALLKKYTSARTALVTALAVYLGTIVYTYAGMLFSHAATVAWLVIALWLADLSVGLIQTTSGHKKYSLFAGVCIGFAIAGEYTAALSAVLLWLFVCIRSRKQAVYVLCGALVPLLLIPLNNMLIFGSPFHLPYENVTEFPGMKEGFFGISIVPNITVIWQLLGSQYRGLFFWSPFLLLCIPGYFILYKKNVAAFWLMLLTPLACLFSISTYPYWHGGWALGPRHLASALPFLIIPAAFGCLRYKPFGILLASASVILTGMATILQPLAPEGNIFPITDLYIPMLRQNEIRENMGTLFGLDGILSLLPLLLISAILLVILWNVSGTKKEG